MMLTSNSKVTSDILAILATGVCYFGSNYSVEHIHVHLYACICTNWFFHS